MLTIYLFSSLTSHASFSKTSLVLQIVFILQKISKYLDSNITIQESTNERVLGAYGQQMKRLVQVYHTTYSLDKLTC